MPAVPIHRDPLRYQGLPNRNTIQAWTSLSHSTTSVPAHGRYIPRTILPLPSLAHHGGPSGLAGLLTASSTLAPAATPSMNGGDIHQPWFKEPIVIVGLFVASILTVCLILAILAHTTGFRWRCIDRDSLFFKARLSSRSPPLPTSTNTASNSSDGQSGSTLFTTRRNIPRLYPKRARQPVDGSSALSNTTSSPETPYNGDLERAGGEHRYSYGAINGMDRSAMSRVKRWVNQTLSTRPTCRGTVIHDSLQGRTAAPFLTISDQHLWTLPIADPREGLVPWVVSASGSEGRNTNFDAAGSPNRRDWRVQKCPRPQPASQSFPWKENLPCSGHEEHHHPRRSQVGDVERRVGRAPQGVHTEYARQTSYSHRAATQVAGVGQPGPRSRRSPSGCIVKQGGQQGDIQQGVPCQKQGRLAPPAPKISITSSDASDTIPAHNPHTFPASPDALTTDSRMEEETRKLLEYLASHTLTTDQNEDTASFHSAAPTMTDLNELLPPKASEHPPPPRGGGGPKSTSSTLSAAPFHPSYPGDQTVKKSNLRRSLDAQSDISLLTNDSSPSYIHGLSSSLLAALSPQLPESGASSSQNTFSSPTFQPVPSGKKERT